VDDVAVEVEEEDVVLEDVVVLEVDVEDVLDVELVEEDVVGVLVLVLVEELDDVDELVVDDVVVEGGAGAATAGR